jgi:hypothetical protein
MGTSGTSRCQPSSSIFYIPRSFHPLYQKPPSYRHFRTQLAPVLADLYTAAWAQDSLPAGFLDGVISVIYKKGEKSNPSNYRPITLLNTDYRLLSRLLSDRLLPCLDILIPHTQTAFLPGRRIGDTILLQQLLPCAMQRENSAALTLFLDQVKAYDTCALQRSAAPRSRAPPSHTPRHKPSPTNHLRTH